MNGGNNKPQQQGMRGRRVEKENPNRINNEITAPMVRIVGENVEPNLVLPIKQAIAMADEMELDLIEISPNAEPPVCRIADYQKFLYQQKRKAKEIKAKQVKVVVKEIRFGPQTDDHAGRAAAADCCSGYSPAPVGVGGMEFVLPSLKQFS